MPGPIEGEGCGEASPDLEQRTRNRSNVPLPVERDGVNSPGASTGSFNESDMSQHAIRDYAGEQSGSVKDTPLQVARSVKHHGISEGWTVEGACSDHNHSLGTGIKNSISNQTEEYDLDVFQEKRTSVNTKSPGQGSKDTILSQDEIPLNSVEYAKSLLITYSAPVMRKRKGQWSASEDDHLIKIGKMLAKPKITWLKFHEKWKLLQAENKVPCTERSIATLKRRYYRVKTTACQNNPIEELDSSSKLNRIKRSDPDRKGRWNIVEDKLLLSLVNDPFQVQNWDKIKSRWDEECSKNTPISLRSSNALQARLYIIRECLQETVTGSNSDSEDEPDELAPNPEVSEPKVKIRGKDKHGNPIVVSQKDFEKTYLRIFRKIRKGGQRLPVNKLKKVPILFMEWSNLLIDSKTGIVEYTDKFLSKLNTAVYAAEAASAYFMKLPVKGKETFSRQRIANLSQSRKELLIDIGQITDIINLRSKSTLQSRGQRLNLKRINEKYPSYKTTLKLKRLLCILKQRLSVLQIQISDDSETRDRQKQRFSQVKWLINKSSNSEAPVEEAKNYWKRYIGVSKSFSCNKALYQWADSLSSPEDARIEKLALEEPQWAACIKEAKPWQAAGPDQVHLFWWRLRIPSEKLFKVLFHYIVEGKKFPSWFCKGRAILLHKGGDTREPSNFRTICCLNTCYKLCTALMMKFIARYTCHAFPEEQFALKKKTWGCTQAHLADASIYKDAKHRKRTLSVGWIDYSKAFDSIPHSYLRWILKRLNVPDGIRQAFKSLQKHWSLTYESRSATGKLIKSNPLKVKCGVLQGDTLSPYLFCLAISPISHIIKAEIEPYRSGNREFSHIYYMDDLKVYTKDPPSLEKAFRIIGRFSHKIGLELNLKKCAQLHVSKGLITDHKVNNSIPSITAATWYKYLGLEQNSSVSATEMWERINIAVISCTRAIFNTKLTVRQKIVAFNTTVIPKVRYILINNLASNGKFGTEKSLVKNLDTKIRLCLLESQARFAASSKYRLYLHPEVGGYGLKSCFSELLSSKAYAYAYLFTHPSNEKPLAIFNELHELGKRTLIQDLLHLYQEYNLGQPTLVSDESSTVNARHLASKLLEAENLRVYGKWQETSCYKRLITAPDIDVRKSFLWLQKGAVSHKVARNICAAQENQLLTREHPSNKTDDKDCRMKCVKNKKERKGETCAHILSNCPYWRNTLMVSRHNSVARSVYYECCKFARLDTKHFREAIPPKQENALFVLFWDISFQTKNLIRHNRPDIVLLDKTKQVMYVCEIAVSWALGGGGIPLMERRKFNKYAINSSLDEDHSLPYPPGPNLSTELGELYKARVEVIPIVIGACGEIGNGLTAFLEKLPFVNALNTELIIERLSRAAVQGSNFLLCKHLELQ